MRIARSSKAANVKYWENRFTALENNTYKKSEACIANISKQFDRAQRQIQKDLAFWYGRLAKNNDISYDAAKKLLTTNELKEFKWTVGEYIKYGQENALDGRWITELENASAKVHISRLQQIQTEMRQTVESLYTDYDGRLSSFLANTFESNYYQTAFELAKGTGVTTTLHALDKASVERILTKPWCADGKAFSDRIWTRKEDLLNTLNTSLTQNLITGKDPQKAINDIAKRFDVEKSAAGRLVMTESAALSSEARKQSLKDLGVEEFEFVATLDSKTSTLCRAMDGQHFKMTEYKVGENAPPLHCNCRSCTVPYFNDEFTKGETRAARSAGDEGYVRTKAQTYKEWAEGVNDKYGAIYKTNPDWEYKDWYKAVVKEKCRNLLEMDLQFFSEGTTSNCMDVSMPSGRVNLSCESTLQKYLSEATPNSHEVEETFSCVKNGIPYDVDGHKVVFEPKPNERRVARLIKEKLGGRIQLMPRVNDPPQIRIADYLWRGIPHDLKTIEEGTSKKYIENIVADHFGQTNRFVFDNSLHLFDNSELIEQAKRAFTRPSIRFLEEIMLVDGDEIVEILTRKK